MKKVISLLFVILLIALFAVWIYKDAVNDKQSLRIASGVISCMNDDTP